MSEEHNSGNGLRYDVCGDGLVLSKSSPKAHGEIIVIDGCEVIGDVVFKGRKGLTSIIFPKSLTRIKEDAFADCIGLKTVVFKGTLPEMANGSFSGCKIELLRINSIENDTVIPENLRKAVVGKIEYTGTEESVAKDFIKLTQVGNERLIYVNTKYIALIEPVKLNSGLRLEYGSNITMSIEDSDGLRSIKVIETCGEVMEAIKNTTTNQC